MVDGGIFRFEGQVTTVVPFQSPCYRCRYPSPPPPEEAPSCAEAGVLGVLPGIVGVLQATEVIKLITGAGDLLTGRLLHIDALDMKFREFRVPRDPQCPVCGENPDDHRADRLRGFLRRAGVRRDRGGRRRRGRLTARCQEPSASCGLRAERLGLVDEHHRDAVARRDSAACRRRSAATRGLDLERSAALRAREDVEQVLGAGCS